MGCAVYDLDFGGLESCPVWLGVKDGDLAWPFLSGYKGRSAPV